MPSLEKIEDILLRPLINEKSQRQREKLNQFAFEVDLKASKDDVRAAVQKYFNVKVTAVHTSIAHGKKRRVGQTIGQRGNWKRAIVTLAEGQNIDFFATT